MNDRNGRINGLFRGRFSFRMSEITRDLFIKFEMVIIYRIIRPASALEWFDLLNCGHLNQELITRRGSSESTKKIQADVFSSMEFDSSTPSPRLRGKILKSLETN